MADRFKNGNTPQLFASPLEQLTEFERRKGEEYWRCMNGEGRIDRFNHQEKKRKTILTSALFYLTIRTVYSQSELSSCHTMLDRSAACELCSDETGRMPGLNVLYKVTKILTVIDALRQEIRLRQVLTSDDGDYYLEVTLPSNAMTEALMNRQCARRESGTVSMQLSWHRQAVEVYDTLVLKHHPFKKRKICRTQQPSQPNLNSLHSQKNVILCVKVGLDLTRNLDEL